MSQRSTVRARDGAKMFSYSDKIKLTVIKPINLQKTAKHTAFLSEWFKEKYLRYFIRKYARVRISQNAKFDSIQQPKFFKKDKLKTGISKIKVL
jgi:hypothetical protein